MMSHKGLKGLGGETTGDASYMGWVVASQRPRQGLAKMTSALGVSERSHRTESRLEA